MHVNLDPVIFSIGSFEIRWYGLMYVIGFLIGGKILNHLAKTGFISRYNKDGTMVAMEEKEAESLINYLLIGMIIFARLFYVVIYNWEGTNSFWDAINVRQGGLSFHGAMVGFILAVYIFSKIKNAVYWSLMDTIGLGAPQGLFFGRIGNFINMELYGRKTDSVFGMVFASDPNGYTRHPSQLYEAFGEGLLLTIIVWAVKKRVNHYGACGAAFMMGYGAIRFIVEYFREADSQMGYYLNGMLTMGQILCLCMIAVGIWMYLYTKKLNLKVNTNVSK